jgi:PBP1b-binding outer membrane lipoprotein LpoB
MRKLIILLLLTGSAAILNGCRSSNPDGIKSETYSKKTNTAKQIVIE